MLNLTWSSPKIWESCVEREPLRAPFFVYAEPAYLIYLMAFVRKKVKTFKWPVEVKEPSDTKPGKFEKSEFTAIFKR